MPFLGVIGEDSSDANAVAILLRRLRVAAGLPTLAVKTSGYAGWASMLRKTSAQLKLWERAGCVGAFVCHDADNDPPHERRARVEKEIKAAGVDIACVAVVPVQELEAWLLADLSPLGELFNWCIDLPCVLMPERVNSPKEELIRLSRRPSDRKSYFHPPTHNEALAKKVAITLLTNRCPSFAQFASAAMLVGIDT